MLGHESECKESNTLPWNCLSIKYGQGTPVDTSCSIVSLDEGNGIAMSLSEDVVVCNLTRSGSVSWAELSVKNQHNCSVKHLLQYKSGTNTRSPDIK